MFWDITASYMKQYKEEWKVSQQEEEDYRW